MMQNQTGFLTGLKLPEALLTLLFIFAPFYYHPGLGGGGLNIPNAIMAWLVTVFIIFYATYLCLKINKITIPKSFLFIYAFPFLATLSGFITGVIQPLDWAFKLLFIWGGALFLLSLYQFKFEETAKNRLVLALILSGFLHASVGILQILLKENMILWFPVTVDGYPSGLFRQINNQATYLVTVILLSFYFVTLPLYSKLIKPIQAIIFLSVFTASFVVLNSGSRVGLLSLILVLPLLLFFLRESFNTKKQVFIALLLTVIIAGGLGAATGGAARYEDKVQAMQSGYSGNARLSIYEISWELVKQSPIVGHGLGSFTSKWQNEKRAFHQQHPEKYLIDEYVTHPHNEIFMWMVEGGVLAVAGIFVLLLASVKHAYKFKKFAILALLMPIALHTQLELPFYTSSFHWFLFLFLLYLLFSETIELPINISTAMKKTLKIGNVGLLVICSVFLLHSFVANYEVSRRYETLSGLDLASQNPYFSEVADMIYMTKLYDYSKAHKDTERMRIFTQWMEIYINKVPAPSSYKLLMSAYEQIGDKDIACMTSAVGLEIYPNDLQLQAHQKSCW